ncbi:MAG: BLUF domain-containing protein [Sphingobacteriaceae bacterium]|nr:MAG: BLUF domain-containing protein [Sphingobacteriaceae bacterium]
MILQAKQLVKYIIYLSSASMYFQAETLEEMLNGFRIKNETNQITGLMLFSEGSFLQLLEGAEHVLDALIKKIRKDKRHHSVVQIATGTIPNRIFSDWHMCFKVALPAEFKDLKGYLDPWNPEILNKLRSEEHPELGILKAFAQNSRLI